MNITIFDTTLRDGDQASGFHMYTEEKVHIAYQLAELGVNVIEAGFAISSPGAFDTIKRISREVGRHNSLIICSLARAIDKDIEEAAKALEQAYHPRIHTFIATSEQHIHEKFRKTREWVLEQTEKAVKKARDYVRDVEFSCEDFGRTDIDYTLQIVKTAIESGATTINLPDTVGILMPSESYEKIKKVVDIFRKEKVVFSVHNHNDLGMATANTIEAIRAGASQVEVTINGIGERAGNTSLEEIVAALTLKNLGTTSINTRLIGETSRLVSQYTGVTPQPNKAIVGANAFAHEAGIHQDGVRKNPITYEIIVPEEYGMERRLTFGPRSGSHAFIAKLEELGINVDGRFDEMFTAFKTMADGKKVITDKNIRDLAKSFQ
ncbi:2-isopropylmalate synthase [Candidatus Woesearchaeota archaeon]|nr:2-isopropylmalate synthase [Candidatus Woesearchaeota archaeon]